MTSLSAYFRRRSMSGFKHCITVADIRSRRDSQATDLRRARVRNVVAIQVRSRQNTVFIWADDHLLKNGIRNAVVDQQLLLPFPLPVTDADAVDHMLYFRIHFIAKLLRGMFKPWFDHGGVLLHCQTRLRFQVAENPALALGHNLNL